MIIDMTVNNMGPDREYAIPSANWETLQERVAEINKRAKRNHLDPVILEEVRQEVVSPVDKEPYIQHIIKVRNACPRIDGWALIAIMEHTPTGNLVTSFPGYESFDIKPYRHTARSCEHCATNRARKWLFLLQDESGTIKQVGKACLKDFTGHGNVEYLALMLQELHESVEEASEYDPDREYFDDSSRGLLPLQRFLEWCNLDIRQRGFISRKLAEDTYPPIMTTANMATDNMRPAKGQKPKEQPNEDDKQEAAKALAWIRALPVSEQKSDYMLNLSIICEAEGIDTRKAGYAASLISTYHKAMGVEKERKASTSAYLGNEGDKITISHAYCKKEFFFDGRWGGSFIYILVDDNGNQIKATNSNGILDEGQTYDLKATIKKLDEYHSVKQTCITRVKVLKQYETAAIA